MAAKANTVEDKHTGIYVNRDESGIILAEIQRTRAGRGRK